MHLVQSQQLNAEQIPSIIFVHFFISDKIAKLWRRNFFMSTHSLRFSPEDTAPQEITLLNASSSLYEGDWPSIPHSHAFTELFYVRDGQGEFLLEDEIYPISKDDLIIVNPHINHTEISRGNPPLSYFCS